MDKHADDDPLEDPAIEQMWHAYLTTGKHPDKVGGPWYQAPELQPIVRRLPSNPRCQLCYYPFSGFGGTLARTFFGVRPSKHNPNLCNSCESFAEKYKGGTELDIGTLFADVRGSTSLAEKMSPIEFSKLINRFYQAATNVLFDYGGWVEKLIGDEVGGLFMPGLAGPDYVRVAVEAAQKILKVTGHDRPEGPWIPVGIGINAGLAYVGVVSTEGGTEITALGDSVNVASRLASQAQAGQIVISEAVRSQAGLASENLEFRELELKGTSRPIEAWVISAAYAKSSTS